MQSVCGSRRAAFNSGIWDRTGNRFHHQSSWASTNGHLRFYSSTILRNKSLERVIMVSEVTEAATTDVEDNKVAPSVLEGTPENFPIGPDELILKAKAVFDTQTGLDDESGLADDFRFEFPVVSLDKASYLKAVRGFGLKDAIPNLNANPYHWRVDPYEPNRVWFTTRTTGTHTGTLKFAGKSYPATGNNIYGAPECLSYVFNEDGKVTSFTGGYVMDRRCGNTQGMGALFGILAAIGVNFPKPGTLGFAVFATINRFVMWMKKLLGKSD